MTKAGKCKYVSSLLGTTEDIERGKQLTNNAFSKLKRIFSNKHEGVETKIRFLAHCYQAFSYITVNCENFQIR